jgi:hypothetical protein
MQQTTTKRQRNIKAHTLTMMVCDSVANKPFEFFTSQLPVGALSGSTPMAHSTYA